MKWLFKKAIVHKMLISLLFVWMVSILFCSNVFSNVKPVYLVIIIVNAEIESTYIHVIKLDS